MRRMAAWYISREARLLTRYDAEHAMKKIAFAFAFALVSIAACSIAACSYDELADDPPLVVPGQTVQQPPPGQAQQPMVMPGAPTTFDPPLAVPGVADVHPPIPPQLPPGQMPPGMQPGQLPPGQMPPGQMPPGQVPPGQVPPGQMQPGQMPMQPQPGQVPGQTGTGPPH